jgi:hypothetical protein
MVAASRKPPGFEALHDEVALAQRALVEARGRLLEAGTAEDVEEVTAALRRASLHVEKALVAAAGLERRMRGGSS